MYKFESNGGTAVESIVTGVSIQLPKITKEGYYFVGWYDNAEFSGNALSTSYYSTTNHTLYARWCTEEEFLEFCDGSSFDKALRITDGGSYSVKIDEGGERIYLMFTATKSGSYSIQASSSYDTYGYLYNSSQALLKSNDDRSDSDEDFKITYTLTEGQTYYIVARMYDNDETGTFTIKIS